MSNDENNKTISLILGSGGARGLAHIGIIHELEDAGYKISAISGCSMGAAVGGIYAAGKLDVYEEWAREIRRSDIIRLLDLSWQASGLVKGDKIIATLTDLIGDQLIEELPIRYTAIATDLKNGKEIWLNEGSLFAAIRASISLPWFLTPVKYKNTHLVDGGILNPVPMAPSFNDHTDYKVAVNLGGAPSVSMKNNKEEPTGSRSIIRGQIDKFVDQMSNVFTKSEDSGPSPYELGNQAFEAMQSTIARHKLAVHPPDFLIELPSNAAGAMDFHRADDLISLGHEYGKRCVKQIQDKEAFHQS